MEYLKTSYPYILLLVALIAFFSRQQIGFFVFAAILYLVLELYAYNGFVGLANLPKAKLWVTVIYVIVSLLGLFGFIYAYSQLQLNHHMRTPIYNMLLGFSFTLVVTKLVFIFSLTIHDVLRLIYGGGVYLKDLYFSSTDTHNFIPSRRKTLTILGTGIAAVPFAAMLYGITKGKYQFSITNQKLSFNNLPKSFDGFRIVQISDIHSGSWDDKEEVARGVRMIQDQNPDMIVFTGDLVNKDKDEIDPFIEIFTKLKAPYGKFAILGNHDYYGDRIKDSIEKETYWADFESKISEMGFDLLKNENRVIEKLDEKIRLVGVENWGAGKWFPKKGDLDKAFEGSKIDEFAILLSHDPTHWEEHVINHPRYIPLTLSGHTHGMQFGINLPGFQWSPIKYRYQKWIGLYEEEKQYLYVNRGFGYLGFPGRVGMWPEITVFELKSV